MKDETYKLFASSDIETIVDTINTELQNRNESPFWSDKVAPFSKAILSVLIPLRDQDLLFNPEGKYEKTLTPELFLEWSDFVSLKTLAFTIQYSNEAKKLLRVDMDDKECERYKEISLDELGAYLSSYTVNLENELLDFPISNYNLHQGVSNVIKSLL